MKGAFKCAPYPKALCFDTANFYAYSKRKKKKNERIQVSVKEGAKKKKNLALFANFTPTQKKKNARERTLRQTMYN